jgi:Protein of unknown function (DUF2510)
VTWHYHRRIDDELAEQFFGNAAGLTAFYMSVLLSSGLRNPYVEYLNLSRKVSRGSAQIALRGTQPDAPPAGFPEHLLRAGRQAFTRVLGCTYENIGVSTSPARLCKRRNGYGHAQPVPWSGLVPSTPATSLAAAVAALRYRQTVHAQHSRAPNVPDRSTNVRRNGRPVIVTCPNGHSSPRNRNFCGECGSPTVSAKFCANGHAGRGDQIFCGMCGVPMGAPAAIGDNSPEGRWNVDPTSRHQYRFWDGTGWTEHVADNGKFAINPPDPFRPEGDKWAPRAAAVGMTIISILAVAAAFSTLHSIRTSEGVPSPATKTDDPLTQANLAPQPAAGSRAPAEPTSASLPAVSVIGSHCLPRSSNSETRDGSTAYCERLQDTELYMWSLYPGDITIPVPGPTDSQGEPVTPAVAVCMDQTGQTVEDCNAYLQRPSNPGDGVP